MEEDANMPVQADNRNAAADRFTSYNARLGSLLKQARERVDDSSSVMPLPDYKPAKTDSYAARLKSQIRRLSERNTSPQPMGNTDAAPKPAQADDHLERGFTD